MDFIYTFYKCLNSRCSSYGNKIREEEIITEDYIDDGEFVHLVEVELCPVCKRVVTPVKE